ncbi:MAG: glutamate-5-semialdehyde dehydrogenase [Gammaproteobacteria bacterium]|nr:glutamate-5-semialdehyde dehydrogenase [Gammaproteobacteria bacterium]
MSASLTALMQELGRAARAVSPVLANVSREQKDRALRAAATALQRDKKNILSANTRDMHAAEERDLSAAMFDRLRLDNARLEAMACSLEDIASLADPVGRVLAEWTRPNGLRISRVAVPLGVIGIIYESRPNVTVDAGALCLKSGNAAILRGGSESLHSGAAIHGCLVEGLREAGLPAACVQRVPVTDREAVGLMLEGLDGAIDVVVPRGGKGLIERVRREARVPVIGHLDGNCHVYVDRDADLAMAVAITLNAKLRRTGVCGAAETLLVDRSAPKGHLETLVGALLDAGCAVRGDDTVKKIDSRVTVASEADWGTEYLDAIIAVRVVEGVDEAMAHIACHSSSHTESIITANDATARRFLERVDSAIVLHNASTQFADGGEFGMGAEIGISTDRFHARGPVGLEQLTSYKYVVRGSGQVRP